MQIWAFDLQKICVTLTYKSLHICSCSQYQLHLLRRFDLNDLSKVTEISGRAGKGTGECIFCQGKEQLRCKTTSVFKSAMLCEYFNCNNEFILFHAILEKFYLIHKTGDCLMHYDCSCTRLTWIHGVSRLAPSVTVAWRLYFYCKIHRVDLTLYNNYLLIHTLR